MCILLICSNFTGMINENVRCFACGRSLRRLDSANDPWIEHCRWFPACPYARQKKGADYIALVLASIEQSNYADWLSEMLLLKSNMEDTNQDKDLRTMEKERIINQYKTYLTQSGFQLHDIEEAVTDLINQGTSLRHLS